MKTVQDYRDEIIRYTPSWFADGCRDKNLLEYFSLAGRTVEERKDSIVVDLVEYGREDWTLGQLKTELGIPGTGNYDDCVVDMIEEIDDEGAVWIYTNPNVVLLDAMAVVLKKLHEHREMLKTEINLVVATSDNMLPYWEVLVSSVRTVLDGIPETDLNYMSRVAEELVSMNTDLIGIRKFFARLGLANFTLVNAFEDDFVFNVLHKPFTVHLHLDTSDFGKIEPLESIFLNLAVAGMRLFVFCEEELGYGGVYGIFDGGGESAGGGESYEPAGVVD
ncbi:MAG: hypothetical protein GY866_00645, partial [Proteobacteria bacterium]|nr:hypothetical protein [Pseudomonadota bacterium]